MTAKCVLDASALLAFLRDEPGAAKVEQALVAGAACSAANWSEVAQKTLRHGHDWAAVSTLLGSYDLEVLNVTREVAEQAAAMWADSPHLSLADRLCLASGHRLRVPVLTADAAWGSTTDIRQIR